MFLAKKKRNRNLIALRKKLAMEWTSDQLLWFSLSKGRVPIIKMEI